MGQTRARTHVKPMFARSRPVIIASIMRRCHVQLSLLNAARPFISIGTPHSPISTGLSPSERYPASTRERICVAKLSRAPFCPQWNVLIGFAPCQRSQHFAAQIDKMDTYARECLNIYRKLAMRLVKQHAQVVPA